MKTTNLFLVVVHFISAVCYLTSCIPSSAQAPNYLWAKSAGGSFSDWATSVNADASGNTHVAGYFRSSSITFGTTTLTNADNTGNTYDMFLAKYDSNGNVLWAKSAGGNDDDWSNSTSVDGSGELYVTGFFHSSTITFGTTTLTNADISGNTRDIFIVKYNANGNVLWAKSAGGASWDEATSISTDVSGNSYVAGYFLSSSITFGSTVLINTGYRDMFLVKYDANGSVLWSESAGGSDNDIGYSVSALGGSGDIYVAGTFISPSITFGTTTLTNSGYSDIYVVKYDSSGNVLWAKSASGSNNDEASSVSADAWGNTYVAGYFSSISITFGSTVLNNPNTNYADMFLVKYDSSGNVLWAKSAGGSFSDPAFSVSADAWGNTYVVGHFNSPTITFGTTTLTNSGYSDIYVVKYDSSGNVLWAISAGGTWWDLSKSCFSDANGNVYMTGSFGSDSIAFGTTVLTNVGSSNTYDIFIAKLNGCNLAQPNITTSGTTIFCQGNSVTLTAGSASSYLWSNGATTQNIIVSASGNYSVTVTDGNGCSATSSATTVTVNPLPAATVTASGTTTFCQGNTVTLTASSASSYLWSNGAITQNIIVSASGGYSVTVTDGNGCSATSSATTVTVNSSPNANAGNDVTICINGNTQLSASGGVSYNWSPGNSLNDSTIANPFANPTVTTTYIVVVVDTNGCINTDTVEVYVSLCTGIEASGNNFSFDIYPNPTSGNFTISFSSSEIPITNGTNYILKIQNVLGEIIYAETLSPSPKGEGWSEVQSDSYRIDLSKYVSGIYFLQLKSEKGTATKKLIIQK